MNFAGDQHRRHLLGLAGLLLAIWGGLGLWQAGGDADQAFRQAAAFKVGIVLALLWLAYPQLASLPRWLAAGIFIVTVAVSLRPRAVMAAARASLWLLPLLPLFWLLRRWQKPPRRVLLERTSAESPRR